MAIINLELNSSDSARLMLLCEKNVRFVAAKTLTQTAQQIQTEVKKHIRTTFVLRKPNFEKSIKVRPATKQNLEAKVYTMAGFATIQQTGGRQVGKNGRLAVPRYDDLHDIKVGRKSNTPGSFLMPLQSGGHVIARRGHNGIEILYHLKSVAYMPKRLEMLEIGESTAETQLGRLFIENLRNISL